METAFSYTAPLKEKESLENVIENRQKYLPETVEAAVAELQHCGQVFSEDELKAINDDIKAQRDNAAMGGGSSAIFNSNYKYNLVEDPNAPLLYSRRVLYIFTVLFGAVFGSIMLAINSSKLKNNIGIVWILLFGVIFTILQIIGANYANIGGSYATLCGLIAGLCIDRLFWNLVIGNSTFYRAKAFWIPLAIGVLLGGLILLSIFYNGGH